MKKLRKLLKGTKASVVVEFALLLPLMVTLVFSIIELGSAWYFKQMMVNASREGARMGAMFEGGTNAEVVAYVQNLLNESGFPGEVSVNAVGAESGPGAQVQVQVTGQHQLPVLGSLVPGFPESINLTATTIMRHE
jgi:Flp pilus assembly protein TadG